MTGYAIIEWLADAGISVSIQGDRLRLTGNLQGLTEDMRNMLIREKQTVIDAMGQPPYPNPDGLVTCDYCQAWRDRECVYGHEVDGWALLRVCSDFSFDGAEYDRWQAVFSEEAK